MEDRDLLICAKATAEVANRVVALESRLAATDARLTALVSIVERYLGDEISGDEAAPMIAALRAPGVELRQCPECDCDPAALATARRERDEAVGVVRDWLDAWERSSEIRPLSDLLTRARALVAGQVGADPRDTEIVGWRESAKAMTGEIATLRASLAEAQGEVTNERAKRIAAEHAIGDTEEALLRVERDRDALRARLDAAGKLIERTRKLIERLRKLVPSSGHVYIPSDVVADLRAWGK